MIYGVFRFRILLPYCLLSITLLADKTVSYMTSSMPVASIRVARTRSVSLLLGLVFLELSGQKQ